MVYSYTCDSVADFTNGVAPSQLSTELDTVVSQAVLFISVVSTTVTIGYATQLSTEDKDLYDTVLANHIPIQYYDNANLFIDPIRKNILFTPSNDNQVSSSSDTFSLKTNHMCEKYISNDINNPFHFESIKDAVTACSDPNQIFILYPGVYNENNPIYLPEGTTIKALSSAGNVIVNAVNNNADLFVCTKWSRIDSITINGPTAAGCRAVLFDQSGTSPSQESTIQDCIINNSNIAIECINIPCLLNINNVIILSTENSSMGIYAHNGGTIVFRNIEILGSAQYPLPTGMLCSDTKSVIIGSGYRASFCGTAVSVNNNGTCNVMLSKIDNSTIAFNVGSDNRPILLTCQCNCVNNVTDLSILAATAIINIESCQIDTSKMYNQNNIKICMKSNNNTPVSMYHTILGNVNVGDIVQPSSLSVGHGEYNMRGIKVLSNSDMEAGTWTDNSSSLSYNLFNSVSTNNCCYIGSSTTISTIDIRVTGACTSTPITSVVYEYWNGASWVIVPTMMTLASPPYNLQNSTFLPNVATYNVRFASYSDVSTSVNNITKNWIRLRVVSDISNIPVVKPIRVKNNNTKINDDGFIEYFGNSRQVSEIKLNMLTSHNTPGNSNIFINKSISLVQTGNVFLSSSLCSLCVSTFLPRSIDISHPLRINLVYTVDDSTAGNVSFKLYRCTAANSDQLYLTENSAPVASPISIVNVSVPSNSVGVMNTAILDINLSDILTQSVIWIGIERYAGDDSDTFSGSVNVINISAKYIKWCEGLHISNF